MSHENIIRAWKDEDFRNSLSEKERSILPEHPAGLVELTDAHLECVVGGRIKLTLISACDCVDTRNTEGACPGVTVSDGNPGCP